MTERDENGRLSWDATWIRMARVAALRSLCVRDKVGAVVVTSENRIVDTGYNNPPRGFQHHDKPCSEWCARSQTVVLNRDRFGNHIPVDMLVNRPTPVRDPDYRDCPSLHAEANVLMWGDRRDREGGTIYVTSHVCHACAKLVANAGLTRVVVAPTINASHRDSDTGYTFLRACGVVVDILED